MIPDHARVISRFLRARHCSHPCLRLGISCVVFFFSGKNAEEYRNILGGFGVSGELATRPVLSLSGGQKSRLAFAQMSMIR